MADPEPPQELRPVPPELEERVDIAATFARTIERMAMDLVESQPEETDPVRARLLLESAHALGQSQRLLLLYIDSITGTF